MFLIISSILLYSTTLAKIFSQLLVNTFGLNLFGSNFSSTIPAFSQLLGFEKTIDILNFGLTLLFTATLFFVNFWHINKKGGNKGMADIVYFLFSLLLFLQVNFVRFSSKEVLLIFLFINLGYLLLKRLKIGFEIPERKELLNSLFLGLYLTFFVHLFSTSLSIIVGSLFLPLLAYSLFRERGYSFIGSPWHLILLMGIFFPWNFVALLATGIIFLVLLLSFKNQSVFLTKNLNIVYSLAVLMLIVYNPLFYFGSLDPVEEGFWLGWAQRLISGQALYRDVAVYYPPLLPWGLDLFMKLFEPSVYFVRLYFHLLKIIGLGIIFLTIRKLLKNFLNVTFTTFLILSYVSTPIKNNVEIRLGVGLLALYLLFISLETRKIRFVFLSGLISALAMGVSIESGIASVLACLVGLLIGFSTIGEFVKKSFMWGVGFLIPMSMMTGVLLAQGSLGDMISQISFYVRAFSFGYFNVSIPKVELQNILLWWKVDRYLGSDSSMWQFTFLAFSFVVVFLLYKIMTRKFGNLEKFVGIIFVYSLVLARSSLGRSDWYHLLFALVPLTPIFICTIESWGFQQKPKHIMLGIWITLLLLLNRNIIQQEFLNDQIFKIQSYANISQRFQSYKTNRSKIALDIDAPVEQTDNLLDFIERNTTPKDKIFAYPWKPELYFLVDRNNATNFDTPYAFFTDDYQKQMVEQLESNKPKYIVYNSYMNFAGMTPTSLSSINTYILSNYRKTISFGDEIVMEYGKN